MLRFGSGTGSASACTASCACAVFTALALSVFGTLSAGAQTATPPAAVNAGTQAVGTTGTAFAVTFTIGTGGALGATKVLTQGLSGYDFQPATGSTCINTVASNSTCTVYVTFKPTAATLRQGAVELTNSSGGVIATALLYGVGQGALAHFPSGIVNTVVGNGTGGYNGDSLGPLSVELNYPNFTINDAAGNIYIADKNNNRVRFYNASTGLVTTIVGTGNATPFNEGVTATSANLAPTSIALDGAGNLYISDSASQRIRKLTIATGLVTTIAGTGSTAYNGDGVSGTAANIGPANLTVDSSGNVYFADQSNNRIRKLTVTSTGNTISTVAGNGSAADGGDGGLATSAQIKTPDGVELDPTGSYLYLQEFNGCRVRQVTFSTGKITTVAGSNGCGYGAGYTDGPTGGFVDGDGNVWFGEQYSSYISEINIAAQTEGPVAGTGGPGYTGNGGAANSATFLYPNDVSPDNAGNYYVSDSGNNVIREVNLTTPTPIVLAAAANSSATQTETIRNDGNTNLVFSSIALSGGSNLTAGGTCAASTQLAPGSSCTISVTFAPKAASAESETLTIVDNSPTSPHVISVIAGTPNSAQTITWNMSPTSIATAVAPFSATASSGLPLTFSIVSGNAALAGANGVYYGGTGTVVLQASQAGDAVYAPVTSRFTVTVGGNAINLGTLVNLTATMYIAQAGTIGSVNALTQGVQNEDYILVPGGTCAVGSTFSAGQSCTAFYQFSPTHPWSRRGGILVGDTSGNIMSVLYLNDVGNGPQTILGNGSLPAAQQIATFNPNSVYNLASGLSVNDNGLYRYNEQSLAIDPVGNFYYSSYYAAPYEVSYTGPGISLGGSTPCTASAYPSMAVNPLTGVLYAGYAQNGTGNSFTTGVLEITPPQGDVVTTCSSSNAAGVAAYSGGVVADGMAFDAAGNRFDNLGVYSGYSYQVPTKIAENGVVLNTGGLAFSGEYQGVALNPEGDLYYVVGDSSLMEITASQLPVQSNGNNAQGAAFTSSQVLSNAPLGPIAFDSWGDLFYESTQSPWAVYEVDIKDPPALNFAAAGVNATSTPQTLTVTNNGNAPLMISSIVASSNFVVTGGTCAANTPVPASSTATCTIQVASKPTIAGSTTGTLTVYDNSLQGSHVVNLSGSGVVSVTGVAPNVGPVAGGTSVTITGEGFTGASAVKFGATPATSFTVNSDYSITAVAPAGNVGTVDITVLNGTATATSMADQFTYQLAVTGVVPNAGVYVGGTSVTITGVGFTNASAVLFGANAAASFVVNSDSSITAVSPAGTVGMVDVKVVSNGNTSAVNVADQFTYQWYSAQMTITTAGTLKTVAVLTQGAANLDFKQQTGGTCATGTVYSVGQVCTVNYSFTATRPGQRLGAVVLQDASGNTLAQTLLTGTGTGALATFLPPANSSNILPISQTSVSTVAVDGNGDVFYGFVGSGGVTEIVAGTGGNAPGTVSEASTVVTVGSGINGVDGLSVDGAGDVFVVSNATSILEIVAGTGGNAPGTVSAASTVVTLGPSLVSPKAVAVDGAGDVFVSAVGQPPNSVQGIYEIVAGTGGNPVGAVSPASTVVTVVSGAYPEGIKVDGAGDVFFANGYHGSVYEVLAGTGGNPAGAVSTSSTILTVGSGFNSPEDIAVDAAGDVFVADGNAANTTIALYEVVAGTGDNAPGRVDSTSTVVTLSTNFYPQLGFGLALDGAGNLFVAGVYTNNASPAASPGLEQFALSTPPTLTFATQTAIGQLDTKDGPQSVTVQNGGNAALNLSSITASTNFAVSNTGTCSTASAVAQSGTCTVAATFTPTALGTLNGALTLRDNSMTATPGTQAVPLVGMGPPLYKLVVSAASKTLMMGTTATVLYSSVGYSQSAAPTGAVTFQVDAGSVLTGTCSGTSSPLICSVSGYPTSSLALGPHTVTVTAAGDSNYSQTSGTGSLEVIAPAASQAVGSPSGTLTANVILSTAGTVGSIQVLTQGATHLDFAYAAGGTCAIGTAYAVGQACTVNYTFTPTRPGQRLGAIQLLDGSGNLLSQTPLTATGLAPLATLPGGGNKITAIATKGGINEPNKMAMDGYGDLFVVDQYNSVVDEIVAGTGGNPAGVVGPASTVVTITPASSTLTQPDAVAVDGAGDLFVGSYYNGQIQEYLAGTGGNAPGVVSSASTAINVGSGISNIKGLAVDGSGNVFVADSGTESLKEVLAGTGGNPIGAVSAASTVITVASGYADLDGLALDAAGDIFATDAGISYSTPAVPAAVYEIAVGSGTSGTGTSLGTAVNGGGGFHAPAGVAMDAAGDVIVADGGAFVNGTYQPGGLYEILAGSGGNPAGAVSGSSTVVTVLSATSSGGYYTTPTSIVTNGAGQVFFTEANYTLDEVDLTTAALSFAATNEGTTSTDSPQSVLLQNAGNQPLIFSAQASANDPSLSANFTLGNNSTCPQLSAGSGGNASLAADATCTEFLSFTPGTTGILSGALVFTDNSDDVSAATQTVLLTGTGGSPYGPTVTVVSPNGGPPAGGTTVTITGTGFTSNSTVNFGSVPATSVSYTSATSLTTVAPAIIPTSSNVTVDITVTTPGAAVPTSATSAADQFTYFAPESYVVTTLTDDATGVAGNCTANSANCSLRDAIAAANVLDGAVGTITFAPSLAAGATAANPAVYSIVTGGTLNITGSASITGPIDMNGKNLLALDGGYIAARNSGGAQVLNYTPTSSMNSLVISRLIVRNGNNANVAQTSSNGGGLYVGGGTVMLANTSVNGNMASGDGGGMYVNSGSVLLTGSTISGNNATYDGGGIDLNAGSVSVTNSTISGNAAPDCCGGGFFMNAGTMTLTNVTLSANTAKYGGGLYTQGGTATLTNATVTGNTGFALNVGGGVVTLANTTVSANTGGIEVQAGSVNIFNTIFTDTTEYYSVPSGQGDVTSAVNLRTLGSYGGPTQTMLPGPSSTAICAGLVGIPDLPAGVAIPTTDQRGATAGAGGYCPAGSIDAGAVQTDYSMGSAFTQQPPSAAGIDTPITPNPAVTVTENGTAVSGSPVTMSVPTGTLSGTTTAASAANGLTTFNNLLLSSAPSGDYLTATLTLNSSVTPAIALSLNSQNIMSAALALSPPAVLTGQLNVGYSQTLVTQYGTGSYTYQVISGTLPGGLTVTTSGANGLLRGTPTQSGSFPLTVQVTDTSSGRTASATFTLVVASQAANLNWSPSATSIYLGAAIGSGILDATSTTPGTISYAATLLPSGSPVTITSTTVPAAGSYTLTATITPTDETTYAPVSLTWPLTVVQQEIFVSSSGGSVASYFYSGAPQSSATNGGGIGAAVDASGNVWSIDTDGAGVSIFTDAGALSTDLRNAGLSGGSALAIDGASTAWIAGSNHTMSAVTAAGTTKNTVTDSSINAPSGVAIDLSGNVWIANKSSSTVTEVIGGAAPAAPLANAVQNATPGVKP